MKKISKCLLTLFMTTCSYAAVAQAPVDKRDRKFAECVARDGMMEVKLAQLAQTNASGQEVKIAAQRMITDHSKANEELKNMAERKGIALPTAISEMQQKHYDKLSKKTGKDFDKAFSKCMIHDHKKAVCVFKKEAKKGKNPEMKEWASGKVPALESHLKMWKEACSASGK